MVGGIINTGEAISDVFYPDTKDGTRKKIFKVIGTPRFAHFATMIPDPFVKC